MVEAVGVEQVAYFVSLESAARAPTIATCRDLGTGAQGA